MNDTPDLSKIVGLIMKNPALISEISKMASEAKESTDSKEPTETISSAEPAAKLADPEAQRDTKFERRQRLLSAMRPYLKNERASALDTLTSILEVFHTVKGG